MILDLDSFATWEEYPSEQHLGETSVLLGDREDGVDHGWVEEIVEFHNGQGICFYCGIPTPWYAVNWGGAFLCRPRCYQALDFFTFLFLAPWHEGAD